MILLKRRFLPLIPGLCAIVGCARYKPMPLTGAAVEEALAPARTIAPASQPLDARHPWLAPVRVNFQTGLTPDSAAVVAVIINPVLRADRNRGSLARAQLLQARYLPNPTLDFSLDPVTGGVTQGAVTAYNVGVSWEITALISHEAKVSAANALSQSVRLDVAWREWQFAQAAKKAVYDLAALKAQVAESRAVDQRLTGNLSLIQHAVDTHERTILELAAAESASHKAHADFLTATHDFQHQVLLLHESLGLLPSVRVNLAEITLPSRLQLPSEDQLLAHIDHRLDLMGLRRGYESQEQTLRAAVLAQFPKVLLGVHQASDNTGVQSTGFGVTVELPIFDQNQAAIAIQKITRQQLFDEYVSRVFEARSLVIQTVADIHALTEQIAEAESAIPALERLEQVYRLAAEQHNVDILSYYTAQNDLAQKRIDLLKIKQLLLDNQIALEIASGWYLPEAAATAPATTRASAEAPL